jgi:5-methylcytosine-specific restriction endonuclease McrA
MLGNNTMPKFTDALRGYAYAVLKRDNFTCRYCGLDGKKSFADWLSLSLDHLLPTGHPNRDNPEYMVAACKFCNTADNLYFTHAIERSLIFDGKIRDELVAQRLPYVLKTRDSYEQFWHKYVQLPDDINIK